MTFADRVLAYYRTLRLKARLPAGVRAMNPYQDEEVFAACEAFYHRFYSDNNPRVLILGINPGRYGAGVTGIPFTDPIKLESRLGISTDLPRKPELSADFIHEMIDAYGGYELFFGRFFINSVSPLGFMREGKNLNYYDTPALKEKLRTYIAESLTQLATIAGTRRVVLCLGEGENFRYLQQRNAELGLFDEVVPLAHPRFILQYRRKRKHEYIDDYVTKLQAAWASSV